MRDILGGDPTSSAAAVRWSRDGASLLALGAPPSGSPLTLPAEVIEPRLDEASGKHSQMATFQDLLRTEADEDAFEELATTIPMRVDPVSGAAKELGPAGLYQHLIESPGRRAPAGAPAAAAVLVPRARPATSPGGSRCGPRTARLETVVADLPVSDEVPRQGVPTGPRGVSWDESDPATLLWAEALDGGDPHAEAEHRDQIMRLRGPVQRRARRRPGGWSSTAAWAG